MGEILFGVYYLVKFNGSLFLEIFILEYFVIIEIIKI